MYRQSDDTQPGSPRQAEEPLLQIPAEAAGRGQGTVARNVFNLVIGQVITTALGILFSAVIGRTLGAADFGFYFLIASLSGFSFVFIDWGQQFFITREVARNPERASVLLGTTLFMRTAGAALVSIPSGLMIWALGFDAVTCLYSVVFIAVSLPLILSQSYGMVFRAHDRMGLDAWVSVINKVAILAIALPALALGGGLPGILVAQGLAGVIALAAAHSFFRQITNSPLRYSREIVREVLIGGGAFFTFSTASSIQPYIDVVILSKLAPVDVVGWYGAAKNILGILAAPAIILGTASFPRLSRTAASSGPFKEELRAALRPILWLGGLAALGTYLFADDAIAIVYGQQHFGPSGIVLKVYAPAFYLLFMNVLLGYALFALGQPAGFSAAKWASVVVSTVLELVLIPFFQQRMGNGGIGITASFFISEFVVFGGALFLLKPVLSLDIFADIARGLASAVLTLLLFELLPPLPFFVGVPVCVMAFSLSSAGFGLIHRSDIELIRTFYEKNAPWHKPSHAKEG